MKLKKSLKDNIKYIKAKLQSDDVLYREFSIGKDTDCTLILVDSLTDKKSIGELVIRPLAEYEEKITLQKLNDLLNCPEYKQVKTAEEVCDEALIGNTVLLVDGIATAISLGLKYYEQRAITEPPTSSVIKGPREGFTENIVTNISLVRRKIKSSNLKFEMLKIGKYSNTPVAICYIDGVVRKGLVKEVKSKLKQINIDAILDSSYISKFLSQHRTSMFKQLGTTEKPDVLAGKILEGRLAIIVDGSPIVLTLPYLLLEDFQSPEDYYASSYRASLSRIIRMISIIIAVFSPGLFVAAQLFHLQMIPLNFLLTIVNSIKGIPLSPSLEMFFILVIFEILNEASVRMPKYVGMVVSIVGGLVLGETAVNAGIISAPALIIIALSGICLYTVPDLVQNFSLIRIIYLITAGSLGGYGMVLVSCFFLIYLVSFENYHTPLLAPFSPIILHDIGDGFYKEAMQELDERPQVFQSPNKVRLRIKGNKDEGIKS